MDQSDIGAVLIDYPDLGINGMGSCPADKGALLYSEVLCTKVCEWLCSGHKRSADPDMPGWLVKGAIERAIGESVPWGIFIAAVIHCGFRVDECGPNMSIGLRLDDAGDEDA